MEAPNSRSETERPGPTSEHIVMEVRRRLCSTGYHVLRSIECECRDGTLVLSGRVPTYYCKQLAQSVLLTDPLGPMIVNLIEVSGNGRQPRDLH